MLLFDEGFILIKTCKQPRSFSYDPVENINTNGKVGAINHGAIVFFDKSAQVIFMVLPTRRSLNQRDCSTRAGFNMGHNRRARRKINSHVMSAQKCRQLVAVTR